MPVHRVPKDDELEDQVARIQRDERIVGVAGDGDGCVLVFTEPKTAARKPGGKETRS